MKSQGPRRVRLMNASENATHTTTDSSTTSEYMRVSPAKYVRKGESAANDAVNHAARRSKSRPAAQNDTGTTASANRSESEWVATSLVPNRRVQHARSR